jgi:hypothetical protein
MPVNAVAGRQVIGETLWVQQAHFRKRAVQGRYIVAFGEKEIVPVGVVGTSGATLKEFSIEINHQLYTG